jgi:uncharacterized protein YqgV (UPF0045/DUF77 family)
MQIAVDISLYPLTGNYIPPIKAFIERLGRRPGLAIEYNSLSTQVRGDFDTVFDALKAEVRETFSGPHRAVLVLKVIGGPTPGVTVF